MEDFSKYPITKITDEMKDVTHPFHDYNWATALNCGPSSDENVATIKYMQWNILAQRLCDGFDMIPDASPILEFDNRLRLMK